MSIVIYIQKKEKYAHNRRRGICEARSSDSYINGSRQHGRNCSKKKSRSESESAHDMIFEAKRLNQRFQEILMNGTLCVGEKEGNEVAKTRQPWTFQPFICFFGECAQRQTMPQLFLSISRDIIDRNRPPFCFRIVPVFPIRMVTLCRQL